MNVNNALGLGPSTESLASDGGRAPEGRERGARRKKFAGYIRAANELRQSYQQAYSSAWSSQASFEEGRDGPAGFGDASIVSAGNEEMILFPSYATRHVKKHAPRTIEEEERQLSQVNETTGAAVPTTGPQDVNYWRQEWERWEDDKAVVDVDVRGWIYSPQRGPLTRKSRLVIGLARHLSGIPAPAANSQAGTDGYQSDDSLSGRTSNRLQAAAAVSQRDEELVAKEAESIVQKGDDESDKAGLGAYSEGPDRNSHNASIFSRDVRSRSPSESSQRDGQLGVLSRSGSYVSTRSGLEGSSDRRAPAKRLSWNQPADMTPAELVVANANLTARLKPFLSTPLAHITITVFFFNQETSQSRTVETNDAGHFWIRAALDFVPTSVRVLASENLSATEDVIITEPRGISLISDIDDTIKHSAIGSGAKQIFRNTFIREMADLTIDGVRDWYGRLAEMGVKLHYVSNSPWQLYPLLVSYFALAGLPRGSFHLKQYTGMLQGIFEPVAERKKGPLERILRDFPERKFILVGDSGEADLEVYTDVAVAHPGRIIGVYIRDVTTPHSQGFFDPSVGPVDENRKADVDAIRTDGRSKKAQQEDLPSFSESSSASDRRRKMLPAGQFTGQADLVSESKSSQRETEKPPRNVPKSVAQQPPSRLRSGSVDAPAPPAKPSSLRQSVAQAPTSGKASERRTSVTGSSSQKTPPAIPPKPPAYMQGQGSSARSSATEDASAKDEQNKIDGRQQQQQQQQSPTADDPQQSGPGLLRRTVTTAYNRLPSASVVLRGSTRASPTTTAESASSASPSSSSTSKPQQQPQSSAYNALKRTITATGALTSSSSRNQADEDSKTSHPSRSSDSALSPKPNPPEPPPAPPPRRRPAPPAPLPRRAITSFPGSATPTTAASAPSKAASLVRRATNRLSGSDIDTGQATQSTTTTTTLPPPPSKSKDDGVITSARGGLLFSSTLTPSPNPNPSPRTKSKTSEGSKNDQVSGSGPNPSTLSPKTLLPPPPPRPSSSTSSSSSPNNNSSATNVNVNANNYNKKEELWRRRWSRAKEILEAQGVELKSWRVGTDVLEHAVDLVRRGLKELEEEKKKEEEDKKRREEKEEEEERRP